MATEREAPWRTGLAGLGVLPSPELVSETTGARAGLFRGIGVGDPSGRPDDVSGAWTVAGRSLSPPKLAPDPQLLQGEYQKTAHLAL